MEGERDLEYPCRAVCSREKERMLLATEVSRLCLEKCSRDRKAVIIVPCVPLVKQHFEIAQRLAGLRVHYVLASAEVDAWVEQQWLDLRLLI